MSVWLLLESQPGSCVCDGSQCGLACAAGLCFSRAMVGLGEGVAPSAATDMVARVIAKVRPRRSLARYHCTVEVPAR